MTTLARTIVAGLAWIYDSEQPEGAIVSHHGPVHRAADDFADDIVIGFCPRGYAGRPVVTLETQTWIDFPDNHRGPRPLTDDEVERTRAAIIAAGRTIASEWNGPPSGTISYGLADAAGVGVLSAVDRYHVGCPKHDGSVFCDRDGCSWYADGAARVVPPTWDVP